MPNEIDLIPIPYIKVYEDAKPPKRATNEAVGYDAFVYGIVSNDQKRKLIDDLSKPFVLEPGKQVLFGIGIQFTFPIGYECEVRPRSGLATKHRIELGNAPGTIDPDYRGEIGILLVNKGDEPHTFKKFDRIAQLIFHNVAIGQLMEVDKLPSTFRSTGGFGSTGFDESIGEGDQRFVAEQLMWDKYFMRMTIEAASLSNCMRGVPKDKKGKYIREKDGSFKTTRKFGCLIVVDRRPIGIGFNHQPDWEHKCADEGCMRDALGIPSGERLEECRAIHAEEAAVYSMIQSGIGGSTRGATVYTNAEPCRRCARMLAELGIRDLVIPKGTYTNNGLEIIQQALIIIRYVNL